MKRSILFSLMIVLGCNAFSQKIYFMYLQTEQEQPFFVRMNDSVYSSTSSGYLIMPKMYDTTYNFSVGFPGNKWPDQKFSVKIGGKDHGYLIKDFGDKGWGLFDLQTLAVQMAAPGMYRNENNASSNVSPFTEMLAKATGDSALKEAPPEPKAEEKKSEMIVKKPEIKKDSVMEKTVSVVEKPVVEKPVLMTKAEPKVENVSSPVQNEVKNNVIPAAYKKSTVIRKSESSTTAGFIVTYIDDYGSGIDTVKITIPEPVAAAKSVTKEKKGEVKFLDMDVEAAKTAGVSDQKKAQTEAMAEKPDKAVDTLTSAATSKNNCVAADDKDFFELRKNMAASTGNDEMISVAKKYFKAKCFSTAQLKNLSTLFLDEAGKYEFFDAADGHVSDIENFGSLESELKDPYYINRFKAMLRN
ncbi:MAG: hypothetical protein LC128_00010 [Chitinophagales bacterium]|nr:hypothetical protein [Chitinophagales bacterium]